MRQRPVLRDIARLVGKFFPLYAPAVEKKISADSELKNYSVLAVLFAVTLKQPRANFWAGILLFAVWSENKSEVLSQKNSSAT